MDQCLQIKRPPCGNFLRTAAAKLFQRNSYSYSKNISQRNFAWNFANLYANYSYKLNFYMVLLYRNLTLLLKNVQYLGSCGGGGVGGLWGIGWLTRSALELIRLHIHNIIFKSPAFSQNFFLFTAIGWKWRDKTIRQSGRCQRLMDKCSFSTIPLTTLSSDASNTQRHMWPRAITSVLVFKLYI